jgi:formate dehydrogenase iron-sulfur subunit
MADERTLQIKEISAHTGTVPGSNMQRVEEVCKLIDVTTCIGCKACEVACVEWNGYPFRETSFDNTYQTMPTTEWNYWNLIKFNEHQRDDGKLMWLMRKDQCMHCEDSGCLRACPSDGAIVKYANGIVDFQQDNCIGCGYCVSGCPFDIPKFNPQTKKVYKCTLCSDRVGSGLEPACIKSCPTGCLHFGTKEDMTAMAEARAEQLRTVSGFKDAGVYDPQSIGGTHVIYVLHDITSPELYGGLPANPQVAPSYTVWKWLVKPAGLVMAVIGLAGVFFHRVFYGPKPPQPLPVTEQTGQSIKGSPEDALGEKQQPGPVKPE